jgi:hypothetical protein
MSNASTRNAQRFLLVLSILCAGTSLPPRAVARAETRGFLLEGGARFGLQRQRPPKIIDPPPPKIDTQEQATWLFTVREGDGESRYERLLATECPTPHNFSVRSRAEEILRFEQPTSEIQLSKAPRSFTVIINPAGVKIGASDTSEVEVKVDLTCLTCKGDKTCSRVRRELVAKIIVYKRQPAPAPVQEVAQAQEPEPDKKRPDRKRLDRKRPEEKQPEEKQPEQVQPDRKQADKGRADKKRPEEKRPDKKQPDKKQPAPGSVQGTTQAQGGTPGRPTGQDASLPSKPDSGTAQPPTPSSEAELKKLLTDGPDVPNVYDLKNFSFKAVLFKEGWLDFVYTLTQPGTVTLTILVEGLPPLVHEFRMNTGWHEELIQLPNPSGEFGVATYSIKAVTDTPPPDDVNPFTFLSLTAGKFSSAQGDRLPFPQPYPAPVRGARLTNAAYGFNPAPHRATVPLGLAGVTFAPRDILLRQGRPSTNAAYSFRTTLPFSGGARADVRRTEGGTSTLVGQKSYRGGLKAGETINGSWDCMKNGVPSLGRHVLFVRAWFTTQGGGKWSLAHSAPVVVRP